MIAMHGVSKALCCGFVLAAEYYRNSSIKCILETEVKFLPVAEGKPTVSDSNILYLSLPCLPHIHPLTT